MRNIVIKKNSLCRIANFLFQNRGTKHHQGIIQIMFCFLLLTAALPAYTQTLLFPNEYFSGIRQQQYIFQDTSLKAKHLSLFPNSCINYTNNNDSVDYYKPGRNWLQRKLNYEHLIHLYTKDTSCGEVNTFELTIDPLFNFQLGKDEADTLNRKYYTNTRGLILEANVNKRIAVSTVFVENQSTFTDYINTQIEADSVIPGQGRYKNFKGNAYDYSFSSGVLSCSVNKYFNFQLGHGKHKIGNGYRSLLWSDAAFNYPFLRSNIYLLNNKIQYSQIYAAITNLGAGTHTPYSEELFQRRAASFQYLSCDLNQKINVSFFQAMIWKAPDSKNKQTLNWTYFNPLIFSNAAFYGLNHSNNNILLGSDILYKPLTNLGIYAQFMLDDEGTGSLKGSNSGAQFGIKYFNAFFIKNLFLQSEYNLINNKPYFNKGAKSYFHYGQNLAYAFNQGKSSEILFVTAYTYKKISLHAKHNLYQCEYKLSDKYRVNFTDVKISYLIHPKRNLNLLLGVNWRNESWSDNILHSNKTHFVYIGFRTAIYNTYWDF